jgi:small-conductance mechanosensitive channel
MADDEKVTGNEVPDGREEINQGIRNIFFNLLFTFICLLVGIYIFSASSEKGNTGLMLLGIPISIIPVIISYFRNGSIGAVISDSFNVYYKDSHGRKQRDASAGFVGMIIQLLVLMIAGIFITIFRIIVYLFKWVILAVKSRGKAFLSLYNVPVLCVAALAGLLFVMNLASPGTVSFEF